MSDEEKKVEKLHNSEQHHQRFMAREHHKMHNRMKRDQVIPVFTLTVYAFNCHEGGTGHGHLGYTGDSVTKVEGGYEIAIKALEESLAAFKKQVS